MTHLHETTCRARTRVPRRRRVSHKQNNTTRKRCHAKNGRRAGGARRGGARRVTRARRKRMRERRATVRPCRTVCTKSLGGDVGEGMEPLEVSLGTCPESKSIREHFNTFVATLQNPGTIRDQYISYCDYFSVRITFGPDRDDHRGRAVFVESAYTYSDFAKDWGIERRAILKRDYEYTMPPFKREAALQGYYHNQLHQCYWLASLPEETCTEHVAALLNYQAAWGDEFAKHADAIETILRSTPVRIESGTILYRYNDIDIETTAVYARYLEALENGEPLVIESVTSTSYYDRYVLNRTLRGKLGQKEFGAILTATTPIPCAVFPLNTLQFAEMEAVLPKKLIVHVNAQNGNTLDSTKVQAPIYSCDISYEKVPPVAVTYVTVIPHVATT